jgi:hypothetical protein
MNNYLGPTRLRVARSSKAWACFLRHPEQSRDGKVVIITDGYATMTEENQEALEKRNVRTFAILFDGRSDCPE